MKKRFEPQVTAHEQPSAGEHVPGRPLVLAAQGGVMGLPTGDQAPMLGDVV